MFYSRGQSKTKAQWASVWHGPAVIIGFEGNSVWIRHRATTLKCASNHIRAAQLEETIPWDQLVQQAHQELDGRAASPPGGPPPAGESRGENFYDMTAPSAKRARVSEAILEVGTVRG